MTTEQGAQVLSDTQRAQQQQAQHHQQQMETIAALRGVWAVTQFRTVNHNMISLAQLEPLVLLLASHSVSKQQPQQAQQRSTDPQCQAQESGNLASSYVCSHSQRSVSWNRRKEAC